jgi:MFS superfamily sulfate permease-like transporter
LLAYAVFGTSRHLIVNPDAATCALVATTLTPLAAGDPGLLVSLSVVLTLFTGMFCIGASMLRLGFVADFLSRPILVGYLNGVAIYIFLGQIGRVFGFPMSAHGIIPSLVEFVRKLPATHVPTLIVGGLTFAILAATRRFLPRLPAPLVAVILGVALVQAFGLEEKGVAVVGPVRPAGVALAGNRPCAPPGAARRRPGRHLAELQQRDGRSPRLCCQGPVRHRC